MKDKKPKLEEIEASHTLGGAGGKAVCRGEGRGEGLDATLCCQVHYGQYVLQKQKAPHGQGFASEKNP